MTTNFREALKAGQFDEAYNLAVSAVKAKPGCADTRAQLATLLCYQNEFERAEKQLETVLSLDAGFAATVNTWRHLLTAAHQRQHAFMKGDAPCLMGEATPAITRALKLLLAQRSGLEAPALTALSETITADAQSLRQVCIDDGEPTDWQDLDDRFWNIIEALGGNGKYYWFDISQIASLAIERPTTLLEQLWLPAKVTLVSGETGHVSLPTIYPEFDGAQAADGASLYGQKTDWLPLRCQSDAETDAAFQALDLTQGQGLRTWLLGEESRPILEFAGEQLQPHVETEA